MGRPKTRHLLLPTQAPAPSYPPTPLRSPDKPCWQCHWYGYMIDSDAAYCVNPAGLPVRPAALRGCCSYELDPAMDIGEQVAMPPPMHSKSSIARQAHAVRERLEAIQYAINFDKAPWQKRRRIISRAGQLSEHER